MATRLDPEYRLQNIRSTLDILDGKGDRKRKQTRLRGAIRSHTISSNQKSDPSLSVVKEYKMTIDIPPDHSKVSKGKYSGYLSKVVSNSSTTATISRRQPKQIATPHRLRVPRTIEEHKPGGDRKQLALMSSALDSELQKLHVKKREVDEQKDAASNVINNATLSSTSNEEAFIKPSRDDELQRGGDVTVAASGVSKWRNVAKSAIRNKLSSSKPSTISDAVQHRSKSKRKSDSSISSRDDEHHGVTGYENVFAAVNAATMFKKQRQRKRREKRKQQLSRLFRIVARLAIVVRRICAIHYVDTGQFELSVAHLVSDRQREDLMFDVTEYKAKKKWRLTSETKRILQKSASSRTEQDNKHVEMALRDLSSLGEYPAAMQSSIARVGWYESYGPNRVIVREGHAPDAFYFILSGSALVSVSVPGDIKPKILAILLRGDSFGELAILNHSKRTSSVSSREAVEMYVISAEDFIYIVMSGNYKVLQDPGTLDFMRSVNFLKEWPLKNIEKNPKKCVFNFFRKNTVLVRDSKFSEWIYVIKSGSCSVLKQLKYVEPESHPKKPKTDKSSRLSISRHGQYLVDREKSFLTRRMIAARAHRESLYKRGMDLPYLMMNAELTKAIIPAKSSTSTMLMTAEEEVAEMEEERQEERWMEELEEAGALTEMKESLFPLVEMEENHSDDELPRYGPQRTFADDLNKPAVDRKGLVDVLFSEQPSLSLVSHGAECMVMSKQFFLQHATDDMLHRVKISMMPFAKEDEIQRSLENQIRWEAYRSATIQRTVDRLTQAKEITSPRK
ncbi:uncharacterized protein [Diadema antillarum]|uniref:uncharacterized protein n=1 Tax=Diadema antillarum TaxID=105358 RepID=UPI003A880321